MFRCKPSRGSKTLALAAAVVVQLTGCSSESNTSGPSVSRITVVNKTTFVVRDLTVSGLGKPMQFRPISGGSDSALSRPQRPRRRYALCGMGRGTGLPLHTGLGISKSELGICPVGVGSRSWALVAQDPVEVRADISHGPALVQVTGEATVFVEADPGTAMLVRTEAKGEVAAKSATQEHDLEHRGRGGLAALKSRDGGL